MVAPSSTRSRPRWAKPTGRRGRDRLYLHKLPLIDETISRVARTHGLSDDDGDEFRAWVRYRLLQDDARALRRYSGRSSWRTYLGVVVSNLYKDFRNSRWGKWRPSAVAVRAGPTGVTLDRLMHRDRLSMRAAIEELLAQDPQLCRSALWRIAGSLPHRPHRSFSGEDTLAAVTSDACPALALAEANATSVVQVSIRALAVALRELAPEEQALLRLRFWEGRSIADIARALQIPQKPLYRRIPRLLTKVGDRLGELGVDAAATLEAIQGVRR